jgi:hypothetical protein
MTFTVRNMVIALCSLGFIALLLSVALPSGGKGFSGRIARATQDARQVGIAIQLFAVDHEGAMPANLKDLVPKYLPDTRLFQHTRLTTPGASLATLPKDSIIAFRLVPQEDEAVVVVTKDGSAAHLFLR